MPPPEFDEGTYYGVKKAMTNKSENAAHNHASERRNRRIENQFAKLDMEDGVATVG